MTVSTKHKAALVGVVSTLLLAGCVTITSPVPAGKDTYMMGLGARGFSSDADLLAQPSSLLVRSAHLRAAQSRL